jgi:hypothetical protein
LVELSDRDSTVGRQEMVHEMKACDVAEADRRVREFLDVGGRDGSYDLVTEGVIDVFANGIG